MQLHIVTVFVSLLLIGSAYAESLNEWDEADQQTVRLPPNVFRDLPKSVREDLEERGCTIPQIWSDDEPHNVIKGHFRDSNQIDWAVLCSVERRSLILVYWAGSAKSVSEVSNAGPADDKHWLQGSGDKIVFSRSILSVDAKYITDHARWYGGELPPHLDHEGIDEGFMGKASTVHYWHEGGWLELQGAD